AESDRGRAEAAGGAERGPSGDKAAEDPPLGSPFRARRQHRLARVQLGRPMSAGPAEVIIILLVVMLAIFVGSLFASRSLVDLSFIQNVGEALGVAPRRRPAVTAAPAVP